MTQMLCFGCEQRGGKTKRNVCHAAGLAAGNDSIMTLS
jgi:hypothetical protein